MFFSKKPAERLDLILDIQSSVVRGALMRVQAGAIPHIVWTKSIDVAYRAQGGSAYLIKMATRAVEDIAGAAHAYVKLTHSKDALPRRISSIHCALSSPWIVSRARTVSQEFSKQTVINRARVAEIIKAERKELASGDEKGLSSIEEKIFEVRLNGYSVAEWEGAAAKSLEASFAVSLAGTRMIERFKEALRRANAREEAHFHSSLLLQYTGIGLAEPNNGPYVLVHVHGELTDLVVADSHSCVLFGSHPLGIRSAVRKIAHALKLTDGTADSLLSLHENGKLDTAHNQPAAKVLADVARGWRSECAKLLSLVPSGRLPSSAIVLARTHEDFFSAALKEEPTSLHPRNLSADEFEKLVAFDPSAERLRTTALYAIAVTNLETL